MEYAYIREKKGGMLREIPLEQEVSEEPDEVFEIGVLAELPGELKPSELSDNAIELELNLSENEQKETFHSFFTEVSESLNERPYRQEPPYDSWKMEEKKKKFHHVLGFCLMILGLLMGGFAIILVTGGVYFNPGTQSILAFMSGFVGFILGLTGLGKTLVNQ
jgi:hypothetical protein